MLIGWASVDITPPRPVLLRGQFVTRISKYVSDPLTATALALESRGDGGAPGQAILVSCDRVSVPCAVYQRLCEAVRVRLPDFDPAMLVVAATHTHTAPEIEEGFYPPVDDPNVMTPTEYADFFVEQVAEGVVAAWHSRAEGGLSWGLGHAVVGHNRRIAYADGSSQMYGRTDREDFEHVEGYEDHTLEAILTWDAAGNLTGAVVNLACPAQVSEAESYVSADFWHEVRVELRRRYGEDLFVLPQCSAAGDQSPHLLLYGAAEERMRHLRGLSERETIARRIAHAVQEIFEASAGEVRADVCLRHIMRAVDLPRRLVSREEYEEAAAEYERLQAQTPDPSDLAAVSSRYILSNRCREVMERYQRQQPGETSPVEVHALRIGDIAMATNPFELFLDYGLRIKARSKAVQTFVVQLAGSRFGEVCSYLPTARALAGRGYGAAAADSLFGPEGGKVLVDRTVEMINELWAG